MKHDYKIYYNDSFVLLTTSAEQSKNNFSKVIQNDHEARVFLEKSGILYDSKTNLDTLVLSEKPGHIMCDFMEHTDVIIAGGGLVQNEKGEYLLIYRRGKWDLPKGKIELKESIKDGAVREVEEETGVKIEKVYDEPIVTYHAYIMKGRKCLKQTQWYKMKAVPGQAAPVPQTEEDIEVVRWVAPSDLDHYIPLCYPLIADLLRQYALKK